MKTYSELIQIPTFEERFEYLKLNGAVGFETFGCDRYLNQIFYQSSEWRRLRNEIIVRDNGCDLASRDHNIYGQIIIHHMNPVTKEEILSRSSSILNPDYLICTSALTHRALHYSDENLLPSKLIERCENDTCPWRRKT